MTSYCEYLRDHPEDTLNKKYHDEEYGFPLAEDAALLERLALEIAQAGLTWSLILKRKDSFHRAFESFDVDTVAVYGEKDVSRLKVSAVIENARRIQVLRAEHGSFKGWLEAHHPLNLEDWTRLFKRTFVFTGGEIVKEFLVSTGYLPGAHDPDCPVYTQIASLRPAWIRGQRNTGLATHLEDESHTGGIV